LVKLATKTRGGRDSQGPDDEMDAGLVYSTDAFSSHSILDRI